MSYFELDTKKTLGLIDELTKEKPYTDAVELLNNIPNDWKLQGCGTGNVTNKVSNLYREGFIDATTEESKHILREGREIQNQSFFLTPRGRDQMKNWFVRNWQGVVGFLVSVATICTALYTALLYYSQR